MSCETETILRVRGLRKEFEKRNSITRRRARIFALQGVHLEVRRGVTLAIVGESGSGKSTLARCLALLETPTSGEILYEGRDLLRLRGGERFAAHREIQMIFQDSAAAMNPRMTASEIVAEPLVIQRVGNDYGKREQAERLMEQVGLPRGAGGKRPLEFSGGERQRLAIARALVLQPKMLIFDEALSSLDLANQEAILHLLENLQAAHALTYVHICHDLRLAARIASEVAVMNNGRIVEQRGAADLFARPEHTYTKELLAAMPPIERILAERTA